MSAHKRYRVHSKGPSAMYGWAIRDIQTGLWVHEHIQLSTALSAAELLNKAQAMMDEEEDPFERGAAREAAHGCCDTLEEHRGER